MGSRSCSWSTTCRWCSGSATRSWSSPGAGPSPRDRPPPSSATRPCSTPTSATAGTRQARQRSSPPPPGPRPGGRPDGRAAAPGRGGRRLRRPGRAARGGPGGRGWVDHLCGGAERGGQDHRAAGGERPAPAASGRHRVVRRADRRHGPGGDPAAGRRPGQPAAWPVPQPHRPRERHAWRLPDPPRPGPAAGALPPGGGVVPSGGGTRRRPRREPLRRPAAHGGDRPRAAARPCAAAAGRALTRPGAAQPAGGLHADPGAARARQNHPAGRAERPPRPRRGHPRRGHGKRPGPARRRRKRRAAQPRHRRPVPRRWRPGGAPMNSDGPMNKDARPPRLRDVARSAGVHVATASRALNDDTASLLSAATVQRVRQAAEALGYRVNGMARALKTRRSLAIGMLVPDITNPFFPPVVRGAEDSLAKAGYSLVLANTDNDDQRARREVRIMLEGRVDGLLLAMARRRDPLVAELFAGPVPVVLVNRTVDHVGAFAVVPDDHAGAVLAVEHLYELGHRHIGHVAGPQTTSTGARRLAGFTEAAQARGIVTEAVEAARFNELEGARAADTLLAGAGPRPTAIVAANDLLALGVLDVAARQGLACPADLSVVGFNDMPFVDRLQPPLTTLRVAEYDLGYRAAALLLERLDGPERRAETLLLTPELVIRGSTAPPRAARSVDRDKGRG